MSVNYQNYERTKRDYEMFWSDNYLTKEQARKASNTTLRSMPVLSAEHQRLLGRKVFAGIPGEYHRSILDADTVRRGSAYLSGKGSRNAERKFYTILASAGKKSRQWREDPLFWLLRAWGNARKAAFSFADLECHPDGLAKYPVQEGPAPSQIQYRAMAARACGRLPLKYEIGEICLQVCNEVRGGNGQVRSYGFPYETTSAWIAWAGIVLGRGFPVPSFEMGTTEHHSIRWKTMGFRPDDARALLEIMPSKRDTDYER